jgi:hypothetical protein
MIYRLKTRASLSAAAIALITIYLLFNTSTGVEDLCKRWSEGEKSGALDRLQLDEASGIAVSGRFPGRLYHVNDSESGPDLDGTD